MSNPERAETVMLVAFAGMVAFVLTAGLKLAVAALF